MSTEGVTTSAQDDQHLASDHDAQVEQLRNANACEMESRARSLRRLAAETDAISADAFRRRASALELLAFAHRCRSMAVPTDHRRKAPQRAEQVKVDQVA